MLEGCHKIGRSIDPQGRVGTLGPLPVELRVVHSIETRKPAWLEQFLHVAFHPRRVRGEWFRLSDADVSLISSVHAADGYTHLPVAIRDAHAENGWALIPSLENAGATDRNFGLRLKELRSAQAMTQEQLARAADVSVGTVRSLEQFAYDPSWPTTQLLAKALGVDCTAFTIVAKATPARNAGRPKKKNGGRKN